MPSRPKPIPMRRALSGESPSTGSNTHARPTSGYFEGTIVTCGVAALIVASVKLGICHERSLPRVLISLTVTAVEPAAIRRTQLARTAVLTFAQAISFKVELTSTEEEAAAAVPLRATAAASTPTP